MKRKRKFGVSVLFLIYLALLVWIILFKLQFNINDLDTVRKINIIPFYYDKEIGVDFHIKEVLENLLIFVPMGIYLQMLLFKSKSYLKLLIIAGISLLLEITPPRSIVSDTSFALMSIISSFNRPLYPFRIPFTFNPLLKPLLTTARIAAFIPGASPPLVRTPMVFILVFCHLFFLHLLNLSHFYYTHIRV